MNCKTRNRRNQKMKENLLKVVCIGLLAFAWVVAALICSSLKTEGAAVTSPEVKAESEDVGIVPDDEDDLDEVPSEHEPGETLAGAGSDNSLIDSVDELVEASSEAISDFLDDVADDYGLIETEGDFSGAPSDIPDEALSRPETEAPLIEEETETQETEVLIELKSVERQISDYPYDEDKAVALAQLMWAEARGCSKREQSLIAWTVLNRVDAGYDGMSDFWSILTAPYQFAYYSGSPYEEYEYRIAVDVLQRWAAEKDGVEDSGRTLPKGYLYYYGDGVHNYFGMNGFSNELWFGLEDPYENW